MNAQKSMLVSVLVTLMLAACGPAATPAPAPTEAAPTVAPALTPTAAPERVALKIGVFPLVSQAPLFVAADGGYFDEQNLDVELLPFTAGQTEIFTALLNGDIDAMGFILTTAHINAIAGGANVRAVANMGFLDQDAECTYAAWMARTELLENGTLSGPAAVPGLRIAVGTGTHLEMMAERLLENGGLTMDDVEVSEFRDSAAMSEALRGGQLDAIPLNEPWITRTRLAGGADVWVPTAELFPNLSTSFLFFGPSMLERDPEVGVRFMTAYLKAARDSGPGRSESAVASVSAATRMSPEEVNQVCWPTFKQDGQVDPDSLLLFEEWALSKGYIDAVVAVEDLWDPQFVEQAVAILDK